MSALRLLLPLGLIGLCLWLADGREALRRLSELSPGWGLATLALLNAVTLLSALRWRRTAAALGLQMPRGEAAREYYMAQFVNQTLPGGVLGDAARGRAQPPERRAEPRRAGGGAGARGGAGGHGVRRPDGAGPDAGGRWRPLGPRVLCQAFGCPARSWSCCWARLCCWPARGGAARRAGAPPPASRCLANGARKWRSRWRSPG
ncbi:lysylphosphatidylglycerol synthase transmembrane domain-containing protein [Salipiger sp. CCB-MM3]|uniref:lysylphosphatidylglycerol synthase transmembrane domain-containing protein n=1 Tax=Salipiger sp. CCB-MM3 TaxID=1792508 RepID=UPI001F2442A0|nr:lysylphosphatidylglycerol synthase transmembrane domain-containing protein [Salipiger sp. CCB-MM3]